VQVVDHSAANTYPIIADPKFEWWMWLPTVKTTRAETKRLRGVGAGAKGAGGAATACSGFVKVAGVAGAVLCGANIISIMYNASKAYYAGKCSRLLIGPGVIGSIAYKDSYCK
jgi:hypothetical protein